MKKLALFTILTLAFFSCKRELDMPPPLTYDGKATQTIAKLVAMRTNASYDILDSNVIIQGIVTSSDKEGNCYKFLSIQDETGGIQIQIDNGVLHQKYPVGQRIFVKCKDLVLSEYNGLYQLGWLHRGSVERLPPEKEFQVLFRDSVIGKEPAPAIIKKKSDLENRKPEQYNIIVKLENCRFQNPNTTYYDFALGYSTTSCNVLLEDGTIIAVRIRKLANFVNELTPNGNGNIVGILTVFGTTPQLIIRSLSDVQNFKAPDVENIIVTTDMSTNPLSNGWSQENISGTKTWEYANNILSFNGDGTSNESWLISPKYSELKNYKNIKLLLKHRVPNSMGNNTNMKIYYTTKALASNFNAADWTEIPTENSQYPYVTEETPFPLPEQATNNPDFRIALRYNDNRESRWFIYGISFKGILK